MYIYMYMCIIYTCNNVDMICAHGALLGYKLHTCTCTFCVESDTLIPSFRCMGAYLVVGACLVYLRYSPG